ncbi:MAG: hypothetical protein AB1721_00840 [Patescibacteria group bacterium]
MRVDLYHHGEDGKKEGETHGVEVSKGVLDLLLSLFGGGKKDE